MTEQQHDDFFDGVGGGGAPSFKWGAINSGIKGEIVDQYRTVVTTPDGTRKTYDDGREIPQLNVTLKTDLRNWDKVTKIPTDPETGQEKPASEDDGTRRIYVKYDMRRAIAVAVKAQGERGLSNGGTLAVKKSGEKPTNKGNPLPLYEARYTPPSASSDFFPEEQQAPAAEQQPQAQAAPPAQPAQDDEPPF